MSKIRLALVSLVFGLTACAAPDQPQPRPLPANDDLYQQLGELAGITRIVEEMLLNISEDQRIVHHFAETDIDRLNAKLIEQLCVESGGPCTYTGDTMADSHAGMGVTEGDFNALVENLQKAMDTHGVPTAAQNRLLARLAPMREDVIYR
ncbi:group I truncated hemoglobin [Pseudomonas sp.]|uniref:group I truncated hemoglobin n=1 Tax=Pseudomonas sp. TaxID=306 RepID=UPI003FA6C022